MKSCSSCNKNKTLDRFYKDKSKLDKVRIYCKECDLKKSAKWKSKNKERHIKVSLKWLKDNSEKANFNASKYRASKLKAAPPWLSKEQKQEILSIYKLAKILESKDGIKRHVDHIIPLQGKNVSGLHVPWNLQILTVSQNCSKGNKGI